MLILDTETTGLTVGGIEDPKEQPHMIEVAVVSVVKLEEVAQFSSLVNPGIPITPEITKITGLTSADLENAPTFPDIVPQLIEIFRADPDNCLVAHNLSFDLDVLIFELRRIGWEHRFPYCRHQRDTVTESGGKRLINWARECLNDPGIAQTHRAMDDVQLLLRCLRACAKDAI